MLELHDFQWHQGLLPATRLRMRPVAESSVSLMSPLSYDSTAMLWARQVTARICASETFIMLISRSAEELQPWIWMFSWSWCEERNHQICLNRTLFSFSATLLTWQSSNLTNCWDECGLYEETQTQIHQTRFFNGRKWGLKLSTTMNQIPFMFYYSILIISCS